MSAPPLTPMRPLVADGAERGRANGRERFNIPSLDGVRAISFLLVFFSHGLLWGKVPGGFGVTTFFFLSGYLITTLLRIEGEQSGRIALGQFYLRRALRIFPPMYVALVAIVGLALAGVIPEVVHVRSVAAASCYVLNYYMAHNPRTGASPFSIGVLWSLCVEEHFYLLFPLLYLLLRRYLARPIHQVAVLLTICAAVLTWRCYLVFYTNPALFRVSLATDTRLDSILLGCVLAIWRNPALEKPLVHGRTLLLVLTGAVPLLLLSIASNNHQFRETFRYTIEGLALYPLFIAVVFYPRWFGVLNFRWVRALGTISYSAYLTHLGVLEGVRRYIPMHEFWRNIVALALTIVVSSLMLYLIERPCARLRKRFSRVDGHSVRGADRPGPTPRSARYVEKGDVACQC